jgi:hypothetical protein
MRSITRALVVVLTVSILATTVPADAAERARGSRLRDRETGVVVVIKRIMKRFFGVGTDEGISDPKPVNVVGGQG